MVAKIKILKKDIDFLRKDIEIEKDVMEKLAKLQEERQKKLRGKIEITRKEALERYTARIKSLEETKVETFKKYDEEIQKYKLLVRNLKQQTKEVPSRPKKGKSKKKK